LFPKLKKPLTGRRFETIPEIKENAAKELMDVTKEAFQDCFQEWKHRWNKCVRRGGQYFEGDPDMYLLNKVHFAL